MPVVAVEITYGLERIVMALQVINGRCALLRCAAVVALPGHSEVPAAKHFRLL